LIILENQPEREKPAQKKKTSPKEETSLEEKKRPSDLLNL